MRNTLIGVRPPRARSKVILTRLRLLHLQPAAQPIAVDKAGLLEHDVAIAENYKIRNALDSKASRKLGICLCIDF
jgi:hypothetical protein